jgi:hypothetical protein
MMEKCDLKRCGNAATGSIEDNERSFSLCDAHFGEVTSAALHQGLSLADAVDAATLAEAIESGRAGESPITATGENPAMRPQARTARAPQHDRLEYRLDCGRDVLVEEIRITPSTLGYFAGSGDTIRHEVIKRLPNRVMDQFSGHGGFLIKPVSEGELPAYTIMVALVSNEPVSDPAADTSSLLLCWLCDDIETSLPEMIEREIRAVEWVKHAVDDNF